MAAAGLTYTQRIIFGTSNGPTYSGQSSVPATTTGTENQRIYSAQVLHGVTPTIDAVGFTVANWLAMGFTVVNDPVQTGTPTAVQLAAAAVTIHLVHGLSGGATDYTIPLTQGQAISWVVVPATLVHDVASITVVGDTNVDCDVYGILLLSA